MRSRRYLRVYAGDQRSGGPDSLRAERSPGNAKWNKPTCSSERRAGPSSTVVGASRLDTPESLSLSTPSLSLAVYPLSRLYYPLIAVS